MTLNDYKMRIKHFISDTFLKVYSKMFARQILKKNNKTELLN